MTPALSWAVPDSAMCTPCSHAPLPQTTPLPEQSTWRPQTDPRPRTPHCRADAIRRIRVVAGAPGGVWGAGRVSSWSGCWWPGCAHYARFMDSTVCYMPIKEFSYKSIKPQKKTSGVHFADPRFGSGLLDRTCKAQEATTGEINWTL